MLLKHRQARPAVITASHISQHDILLHAGDDTDNVTAVKYVCVQVCAMLVSLLSNSDTGGLQAQSNFWQI